MAELRGVEVLQSEIEKAKDKLRGYNENIKKLTGRDPTRPGVRRMLSGDGNERNEDGYPSRMARGRGRLFGMARRGIMEDNTPPAKRRAIGGAFSRLGPAPVPARRRDREDSPYEEELPHKLSVHSSVVATSRDAKNREDILQEQTKDKEGMQRNRRMFGLLMGTLNKFKTESKTLQTKEVQRKKIEEKLEENAEKEKRKFKQETKLLMEEMHLEQSKISRLQQKMEMVQEHGDREEEMKKLYNFIATKTKPRIFWRPQQMSSTVESRMKDSKKVVDDMLQEGRGRLEKEIQELMARENKREERIKMRLREDGLFGEEEEGNEEEEKVVGEGSEGRTVVDVKDSMSRRLGKRIEDFGSDEENEDTNERDAKKKPRRTVVVENDKRGSSVSDSEEDMEHTEGDEVTVSDEIRQTKYDEKSVEKVRVEEGNSSSDDDKGENSMHNPEEHKKKDLDKKRKISAEEREKSKERENERHKGEERESHNRDKRSRREDRKEKKREGRDDSGDRDRHRRRRNSDKGSKKDKDRDGQRNHREGRKEKRERRDSYEDGKKHSSKHSKDKRRDSDSDNEIQIKQEKGDRDIDQKCLSHRRVVERDGVEEENREENSTSVVAQEKDAGQESTTPTEA